MATAPNKHSSYIKAQPLLQHVALLKSNSDANTYLVVSTSDPLQRSLMDLELKDHLLASAHPHAMPNGVHNCMSSQTFRIKSGCTRSLYCTI